MDQPQNFPKMAIVSPKRSRKAQRKRENGPKSGEIKGQEKNGEPSNSEKKQKPGRNRPDGRRSNDVKNKNGMPKTPNPASHPNKATVKNTASSTTAGPKLVRHSSKTRKRHFLARIDTAASKSAVSGGTNSTSAITMLKRH